MNFTCPVCQFSPPALPPKDIGEICGNTARFKNSKFRYWKCPQCESLIALDPVNYADIYSDYPLNKRKLDVFAKGTLSNLLNRLTREGLKTHHKILDYGSGNGLFVEFLKEKGYSQVTGYDPYIKEFSQLPPNETFDFIVANDVIEHVADPKAMLQDCVRHLAPNGILYVGTADATGIDVKDLKPFILTLHAPFHRVIMTPKTLKSLVLDTGLKFQKSYLKSYLDTLKPFSNYRFLNEFSRALDFDMDRALDPANSTVVMKKPLLIFWGLFGYFFPTTNEPAIIAKKI